MLCPVGPGPASAFRYAPGVLSVNAYHVASCPLPIGYDDPDGRHIFNSFVLVAFVCGPFVRGCAGLEHSVNRLNRRAVSASVEVWQATGSGRKEGSSRWPERILKIYGTE